MQGGGEAGAVGIDVGPDAGVENTLGILRHGLDSALLALGRRTPADVRMADLDIPPGFFRALGTADPELP